MTAVRPEYPRPHFDRSHSWLSLNGQWEFHRDPEGTATAEDLASDQSAWAERIVVPYAWETDASEVGANWLAYGWYRRELTVPTEWAGQRTIVHFGAVHHAATVWVNGVLIGEHEGGYTPFEIDVTDALDDAAGSILVRVSAPIDKRYIVHGKQRSIPRDDYDNCSFTPSSGIWQSVWLEARPATYIAGVRLDAAAALDAIEARIEVVGPNAAESRLRVTVEGEPPVEIDMVGASASVTLPVTAPRQWSPQHPNLYNVTVEAVSSDGTDTVVAYTGLRTIEVQGESLVLNGERLYVRGVLDQGYWPRSGITALTDADFVTDIELAREAGFTVIRKHLKLEDPRFLYHADRLGMLVWAEPASTGRFSAEAAERFEAQVEPMVRRDANHPSIVIWGLYNEEWGLDWDVENDPAKQSAVRQAFELLKSLDPTRPAVDNSGWSHVKTDIVDWHVYDEMPTGWATKVRNLLADGNNVFPVGIGIGVVVDKQLMALEAAAANGKPNLNSEFGGGFTSVERGWNLRWQTLELRRHDRLSGYVWTELYDVEHEMAGLYDADRKLKDTGGSVPADTNADTVLIPEITPLAPGQDAVPSAVGTIDFDVRVSHHGSGPIEGDIVTAWGAVLGDVDRDHLCELAAAGGSVSAGTAHPYLLSDPVRVSATLPDGTSAARLHLALVAGGEVIAITAVDVVR